MNPLQIAMLLNIVVFVSIIYFIDSFLKRHQVKTRVRRIVVILIFCLAILNQLSYTVVLFIQSM